MFTGLIEEMGKVLWLRATERGTQLEISAVGLGERVHSGDSVAVNGCCLTVSAHRDDRLTFDLLEETISRSNLKDLRRDSPVNLEQPLVAGARLGGHFVQGHVDCAVPIIAFEQKSADSRLEIQLPDDYAHYVVEKGSVAVDGISLTIAELLPRSFVVWIVPHTRRNTNLQTRSAGDRVNLEFDILAKYVERQLTGGRLKK